MRFCTPCYEVFIGCYLAPLLACHVTVDTKSAREMRLNGNEERMEESNE
jgi:hypothetical protein